MWTLWGTGSSALKLSKESVWWESEAESKLGIGWVTGGLGALGFTLSVGGDPSVLLSYSLF